MQKIKEVFHKDKSDKHLGDNVGSGHHSTGYTSEKALDGASGKHGTAGAQGEQVVGVGAGTNYPAAKQAAREAARQNDEVSFNTGTAAGTGRPAGTTGTKTGTNTTTRGATTDTTTKTAGADTTGAHVNAGAGEGDVIDRKYYTGQETRPQDQAVVEKYREHNPYEKEYKTTVQHTGRERQIGAHVEDLGTDERVIGQDHHVGNPHHHIHRNLPEGAIPERPGGEGWVQGKAGPVCDEKTFTVAGDRTVDKERVTNLRQHNQFEKEFEVATRLNDERSAGTQQPDLLKRDHVVVDEKNKNACAGHPDISN